MSNNPGKKGRTAPWVQREREDRDRALEAYLREHHPAYRRWAEERSEIARRSRAEAEGLFPGLLGIGRAMKHSSKAVSVWEKTNRNPLTREEAQALEKEFSLVYIPIDRS